MLAGLEVWDRISFYGMQSLLVLYMAKQLLLPGHVEQIVGFATYRAVLESIVGPLTVKGLATQTFGLYVGLVALTPILGGFLGDRFLGRRRGIILGGLLMTGGHFALAFDESFLLALLLLIFGAGFVRGNVAPQIGELYAPDDRRRGVAFQIYGSVINFGAFVAPLATGALGKAWGWHYAFAFAGFGMLIGLAVYLLGQRHLPPERPRVKGERVALTRAEWRPVFALLAVLPVASMFWVAQSQIWNTYNLWVEEHLQLDIGGWTMPVNWLQSLDGLAPFILLAPVLMLWAAQARRGREPNEIGKIAIGCFIFGAATLLLAGAQFVTDAAGKTPLIVAVAFHFVSNLGWLFVVPTLNALFSRVAPRSVNATLLGVNALSVTIGSFISGRLGSLYELLPAMQFWLLHAAVVAGGGALMLLVGAALRRDFAATSEA